MSRFRNEVAYLQAHVKSLRLALAPQRACRRRKGVWAGSATLVVTPQDALEAHLNHLARKSVGETLASEQTRQDVQEARGLIGSSHKLYRGSLAFYLKGRDLAELDARGLQLANPRRRPSATS
jgi:hypothetical protein